MHTQSTKNKNNTPTAQPLIRSSMHSEEKLLLFQSYVALDEGSAAQQPSYNIVPSSC